MTLWHSGGSVFGADKKFICHDIVEYRKGQLWIVAGLADDGQLYYFTRRWEGGITVVSDPELISEEVFEIGGTSTIFLSEKDGYFQFSLSTRYGIRPFWIKPEELFPPPPVVKLPLELSYPKLKVNNNHIGVCTCLIPPLLFNHIITDEDFATFLNWFCALRAGNQIRGMAWGGWEPHTWPWMLQPYVRLGPDFTDDYNLDEYNEDYFALVDRRLAMMRERNLTSIISLNDHCSIKPNPPGYWRWSWWNGDNNVNGTAAGSNQWGAMYHHYEEQHQDKPTWVRTGEYLMAYYNRMFALCAKHWPFVKIEFGNEVRAAQGWHQLLWNTLQPYRPAGWAHWPKFSAQSSVNGQDIEWLKKKRIEEICQMSIHGCCDGPAALQHVKDLGKPNVRYILSQDGCTPTKTPQATRHMIRDVLSAGFDVELNLRPHHKFEDGEWKGQFANTDWTFRTLMENSALWFEAAALGWADFLG